MEREVGKEMEIVIRKMPFEVYDRETRDSEIERDM